MDMKTGKRKIRNKLTLFLIFIFLIGVQYINAQQKKISGVVHDESGETVIGANIKAVGAPSIGTVTDIDGKFSLALPEKVKNIQVSYVGMSPLTVAVKTNAPMDIMLKSNSKVMDEVVVIGYGTTKRKDLTGSVSSIGENVLKNVSVTSAASALSGRLAGVNVVTTQGSPDAAVNIRVRGGGSITQDNSPLFIVDGFQVGNINDIPPGDIESIDVLKDATSTAIYGAKGANGVILVTTKSGKQGRTVVKLSSSVGFNNLYNATEVLSPYEYVYFQRELDTGDGFASKYGRWEDIDIYKSRKGTDWQGKLFDKTGIKQNYNLNISGGDQSLIYSISYTHDDESYIMKTSKFNRDNLNVKINKTFNKKLKLEFNSKMTKTTINGTSVSSGSKLRDCIKYPPIGTLESLTEDDLGDEGYIVENISNLNDPFYNIANEYKKQNKFSNSYDAALTWNIIKGLSLRTEGTYAIQQDRTDQIYLKNTGEASQKAGQPVAYRYYWDGNRWAFRSFLSYNLKINKHRFDTMAGYEANHSERNSMTVNSDYYPLDYTAQNILAMWNNGTSEPTYTTVEEPRRSQSFFGRANYIFDDRYYLTFTARADGTNVFSPGNKWGFFPAGSIAWRVSEEEFLKSQKNWLSNLKLRLSYGKSGNARVGSYWRQTYSPVTSTSSLYYINEVGQSCLQPTNVLRNDKLTWESKYSFNSGLDFSILNNRLNLTVDWYRDVTKNLIMSVQLPSNSGYSSQYQNLGQTTNKGIELTLNANLIQSKDFYLDMNFNISFNKNRVDALYGTFDDEMILSGGGSVLGSDNYRIYVGKKVGLMYGYVNDGMYSFNDFTFNETTKKWVLNEGVVDCSGVLGSSGDKYGPGHMKLKDLNNDGKIDANNDRKVIGNAMPKHTGGLSFNAGWKGFDLTAMFNWSYGNDILNVNKIDYNTYSLSKKYQNLTTLMSLKNRFTTIDPVTGNNIYSGIYANPERLQELNANASIWHPLLNTTITSDWAVEDGSFLRLGTLILGYTLPKKIIRKFGVQDLRMYATANNLFCWTAYSGQDPEVSTSSSNLTPGIDNSAYPKAHSYIFGVNVTF